MLAFLRSWRDNFLNDLETKGWFWLGVLFLFSGFNYGVSALFVTAVPLATTISNFVFGIFLALFFGSLLKTIYDRPRLNRGENN